MVFSHTLVFEIKHNDSGNGSLPFAHPSCPFAQFRIHGISRRQSKSCRGKERAKERTREKGVVLIRTSSKMKADGEMYEAKTITRARARPKHPP